MPETPLSCSPCPNCRETFAPPSQSRIEQESCELAICPGRRGERCAAIKTDVKDLCRN